MSPPHDYLMPFGPDGDEPEDKQGKTSGIDLRKPDADPAQPPPEVPPLASARPQSQQATPVQLPQQAAPRQAAPSHADEAWVEEWDEDEYAGEELNAPPEPSSRERLIALAKLSLVALLVIPAVMLFMATNHLRVASPMLEATPIYSKKVHFYPKWPFVMRYYLMLPPGYDARFPYPLVVALPDEKNISYPGIFLAQTQYRQAFPAIVLVPLISQSALWHTPPDDSLIVEGIGDGPLSFDTLDAVVTLIVKLAGQYTVDPSRVYITGHSMGAIGAYAAATHHGNLFAAAVTSAGAWAVEEADMIKIPVLSYHGAEDPYVPAKLEQNFVDIANANGANITYIELPRRDHDIWQDVYSSPQTWQWLLTQRRTQ